VSAQRVSTLGGIPRVYSRHHGGYTTGCTVGTMVGIPQGVHRVHKVVYPRGVHRVGIPGCICHPTYPGGYTRVYYASLLYLPGYTHGIHCRLVYRSSCPSSNPLPDDEALGSNLGLIRDMRRREGFLALKV